ncbi:ATP-binding cassette, subfamily C, CydC [Marinospirillum celere]|uniref:ATP-binding cassette, subfamily C, CydC n=1 Tax=Marinospirillum celere TaxID=1122252 RepID=A0A1I1FQB8_9GAMM|nr:thiol reductant ABC exporter subunit CydC [Marinospirillum celere]SFC01759.1 ATP-binding cassette, subfamily C, CydC [Marinospirillum celere]
MHPLKPWLQLLKVESGRLWLGSFLLLVTLVSAVGLLGLSGWFITATGMTALAWAAGLAVTLDIYTPGGGIRFFALSRTVGRYLERVYNHDTVLRLLARLRQRLFQGMTQLDPMTLARWRASQWVNRLITDVETLDNLYLRLLAPPLVALVTLLLVVLVLALFHLQAALLVGLGLLLILAISTYGMALAGQQLSGRLAQQQEVERSQLVEHLQGLGALQASHSLKVHQQARIKAQKTNMQDQARLQRLVALGQGLQSLMLQLVVAACLLLLAGAWQEGWVSGPVLVMLPLALLALQEAFQNLPAAFANWGGTLAAARRLNQASEEGTEKPSSGQLSSLPDYTSIEFQKIHLLLGRQQVLKDFQLEIAQGEKLAVLAASGKGKSSLASLLARQLSPQQGQLLLKTQDQALPLEDLNTEIWLNHLGYLTQETELFAASIADNLRLAKPDARDAELWQALETVDLAEEVAGFARQLDTWVGETGQQLSGGQARRLALARLLLKDAPLIILDEPFRGLDWRTRERLKLRLDSWLQGRTVFLLAHNLEHLPRADRWISL